VCVCVCHTCSPLSVCLDYLCVSLLSQLHTAMLMLSVVCSLVLPVDGSKCNASINLGICIAPTLPFWATLGAESRVCYPGNTADMQTQ
jgi:hypothetical protein